MNIVSFATVVAKNSSTISTDQTKGNSVCSSIRTTPAIIPDMQVIITSIHTHLQIYSDVQGECEWIFK